MKGQHIVHALAVHHRGMIEMFGYHVDVWLHQGLWHVLEWAHSVMGSVW